ncbi:MAG TPA: ribosome-associated translation inhibitor RaiA [Candidatus Coprovivens excrementavium]|nr:ribosome-associated translation inhibitor RaiA [Candidatus Coprovivens excrementavium]
MKLNVRGEKVTITQSMKAYITEKLSKLDKYFENPEEINTNVLVRIKGLEQIIEVTALTKRFTLRAEESNEDFYAAVDLVVAKLERQIRKNKDRLNRKYKNIESVEFNFDYEQEESEEENASTIVKRKNISMKPMDEEEAMLQIELLNHDFFVFKNIDEECVSVLYKRKDGNYGIINMK